MKYALAIAGLAAIVTAETWTVTATEDVTVTSCGPSATGCPVKNDPSWAPWDPKAPASTTKKPESSSAADWGTWDPNAPKPTTTTTTKKTDDAADWGTWDPSKSSSAKATTTSAKSSDAAWPDWDPSKSTKTTTTSAKSTDPSWPDWDPKKGTSTSSSTTKKTSTEEWYGWSTTSASVKSTSTKPACPSYTATGPPAWFSQLPSSVLSSIQAEWTGAPPADWCYYTYSIKSTVSSTSSKPATATVTSTVSSDWNAWSSSTPVSASSKVSSTASSSSDWNAWGSSSSVKPTSTSPVKPFTGAATKEIVGFGAAALAAVAFML